MENQCLLDGKSKSWRYKITVEPTLLLYTVGATISQNLQLNLLLDKSCRVYNVEGGFCETEMNSEVTVSQINTWKLFFSTIFVVFFTSLTGPIIDKNPKTIPFILMIPILGQLFNDIGNYFSVYFWSWHIWVNCVLDAVLVGFTGSTFGFTLVCLSYLSYTSSTQERTVRIGFLYFCLAFALSLGYFCSGYVVQWLGYYYGFGLCWFLYVSAILIGMRTIEDVDISPEKQTEDVTIFQTIQQNFTVLTKERENSKQTVIILCLFVFPLVLGYPVGELSVLYLFLRRRFAWDATEYGVYMSFKMIVKSCGALLCTEILKRRLRLHDATIGAIGCALQLTMSIFWLMIYYSWQVYAVTIMGAFEIGIVAVLTSLASKCVKPHEYGRLSSLFGFTHIITPVVYPLYNMVYESSIYTFPSSFFLITISLTAPCVLIFCILRYFGEKMREKELLPE
ncbi:uncharacterized protein LOC135838971 [Planococcus citri]|uniref:uncharacterized protein LOC135838971 n=1 Tax=Planococcus citri TaxID=170843 RepID=UPI0031F9DFFE